MGKYKKLIIAALVFFLLVNTTYYWEGMMGGFAIITTLMMIIYCICLAIILLVQTYRAAKERLQNTQRLMLIGIISGVLALTVLFPNGIVDFEKLESDVVFIAEREGVANCMITLKLRKNGTFKNREVCFGVTEKTGTYQIKGDNGREDFYEFAVVETQEI